MKYNDGNVAKIIENYFLLKNSLKELEDIDKEKIGVVFGYAAEHYTIARKAIEFLESIPESLKEKLKISDLEKELHDFTNVHIKLPLPKDSSEH